MQPGVEGSRRAAQHAVAGDVGADDLRELLREETFDQFGRREGRTFQPALDGHRAVADVGPEDQPFGAELREPLGEAFGFADGEAAADGAVGPGVEDAAQGLAALDAAAVLHFESRPRRHALQHREVAGLGSLGAVEVDHVQASDARLLEAQGGFERVAVVGFSAGVVAQSHALAADVVRCRYDFDHNVKGLGNSV